jgi:hypothetical protein
LQVSKKEYNGVLLEMLISEVWEMSILFFCPLLSVVPPGELLTLPFYRLKGRIRLTTNPRRCLGGKGEASTVDVAVATCCSGRAIPYGRRRGRGLLVQLMAVEAGSERG